MSSDSKASSITFAPLPPVDARKRRHNHPIGLASRAEMLRRSRQQYGEAAQFQEGHMSKEEQEMPLPDFGKLVKGLWRSVSRHGKEKNVQETPGQTNTTSEGINTSAEDNEDGEGGVWMEEVTWATSSSPPSPSLSKPSSTENINGKDSRRDTICTVDSGSFLDELDAIGETQTSRQLLESVTEGERREFGGGAHQDLGSHLAPPIAIS